MKKLVTLLLALAMALSLCACGAQKEAPPSQEALYSDFIAAADPAYAYGIAYKLATDTAFFNSAQGGRTAGSDAEHAAAAYLAAEMEALGLTDVEKVAAPCDRWQFNGATFTVDGESYDVYSYATAATPPEGITAEVVYLGDGTMWDYENVDVTGKIVLIDIDQRANWWITYPMLEAQHRGAAAILAANVGGYAQIADDAMNCQDICAPTGIPCLSIGLADARALQEKIAAGAVTATLTVDNEVALDAGTTYNVLGKIKGKSADHQIVVGGHYDVHYWGFQDDSCAVGLVLAMAKAMLDAGYQPENDIVFCLHGAEEWGASNTQYDWAVGAWEMINTVHPDWVGKTLAFINFELPAYEFADYTSTCSAPEMYSMLDYFANTYEFSPDPEGCFPAGVLTEGYQTYTYSDDFSYYAAGVPSTVNGFLLQKDGETVFPFYEEIYHSQYDTPDTYNEAVMRFNLQYYGAFALYLDQTPALYLDFTAQYDRIAASLDAEVMTAAGVDMAAFNASLATLRTAAEAMTARVEQCNSDYRAAYQQGDSEQCAALWAQGKTLTQQNLAAFAYAQQHLLGLMYERPIVPHEAPQENIALCRTIIDLLQSGDVATVVGDYAWTVNNIFEWYAMYFSPEVIAVQDEMMWGADNADNLFWGTDIGFEKADVDAATRSLYVRQGEQNGDFSKEIAVYESAAAAQSKTLAALALQEMDAITALAGMLA